MRKTFLALASLVVVMAFGSSSADAQVCVSFTGFCDGLELDVAGGQIDGTWQNWDCLGSDAPVQGSVGGGEARVFCLDDTLCPFQDGSDWLISLDIQSLTFDLFHRENDGTIVQFLDDSVFSVNLGVCPFEAHDFRLPKKSTITQETED